MSNEMDPTEYELLTKRLFQLITDRSPGKHVKIEHNVKLRGRSTSHQIDVLWELEAADGSPRRIVIECRRYAHPLKQKDVFAFDGVVRDLDSPELPTTGVMVTTTGYQSGAQSVADTYGVVILHLRKPTPDDLENRLTKIVITATARMPTIDAVNVTAEDGFISPPPGPILASEFGLLRDDGSRILLQDFLWAGELGNLEQPPVAPHSVTRLFNPPVVLTLRGEALGRITGVSATVGEVAMVQDPFAVGGAPMAWMIGNVLDSTQVWFTDTSRTYVSDDQNGGVALADDVLLGRPTPGSTS
ncbi:restriction endonuclease [Amycolatopsis sp. TNS106]|uniref:restriction endonuclease n=1 Tax=Amycolatopsis sp. TNS106 TaxID=2861750 RepID=UPI001C576C66|nr:restriction endonuclease [Amycolatopsis sp. TNS106]QXV57361.1 hypothetical protein CVV72_10275 [Amycolatopsis sp. TNS106]